MRKIRKRKPFQPYHFNRLSKRAGSWVAAMAALLLIIGGLTSVKPTYRIYSETIQDWTSQIEGPSFLYLFSMENKMYKGAYPDNVKPPDLTTMGFQLATSLTPNDPRSLLGRELPGLDTYHSEILVAGEGTDYTNLPIESHPPLDVVMEDREAVDPEEEGPVEKTERKDAPSTGGRNVVLIYNTHNRESFLPHLAEGTEHAYHDEVNITKVSDRLAKALEANGIGAKVNDRDVTAFAKEKGVAPYDASRTIVTEAMAANKDIQYIFDLHRDGAPRDVTTTEIDGEVFAKTIFVIGAEHEAYEKNAKLAADLHELLEEKFPGLSRGVIKKKGNGVDGKYNQDLSEKAILLEFGGHENSLDEIYRSVDAVAEVFSEYYWEAEKVSGD
ncbi:stage II sporulation protein P [Thalassobacillus devorans]|uniref:Stage II sporulation protein P n=1 Tax=Thalassobacillus devorans TaxID=279813 RepID=A0ABQ1P6W9_9BACI|nr:stage II sporulation protein P [Thalassobacillus devorans]NIK29712.1 stage II sporulation protein P [Thalassobacillus devorans]GGC92201.1 stage II sporulation protein P [Thalassobacillus devorans]